MIDYAKLTKTKRGSPPQLSIGSQYLREKYTAEVMASLVPASWSVRPAHE